MRPVLIDRRRASSSRRSRVGGWELPAGVHVAPCIYLTHRRPELYPDPTAFRPERFLGDGAPDAYAWLPFGGGIAPLRRRRVRHDGDARGAARGRRARRAAPRPARRASGCAAAR